MVGLCRDHHPEADAGAFTVEELREVKRVGRDRSQALGARFNWMREELLAVVGGNFCLDTHIALRVQDFPVVWFNRDPSGRLLVNLQMLSTSGKPRLLMLGNFWVTEGSDEREIVCPPSGRLVSAKYPNGDRLKVEFREVASVEELDRHYPPPELPARLRRDFEARGVLTDLVAARVATALGRLEARDEEALSRPGRVLRWFLRKIRARIPLDGPTTWDRIWKTLRRDEPFVYVRVLTKNGQSVLGTMGRVSRAALSPQPRDLYIEQVLRPVRSPDGAVEFAPTKAGLGMFVAGEAIELVEWISHEGLKEIRADG